MAAHALAEADIYRASTHNKGIMNGIDALAMATGNDVRAIEAGAHAYAAISGSYRPLTNMEIDLKEQLLTAKLTLPLAVGVVGGLTAFHPGVKLAHKILGEFAESSQKLCAVMASLGLAQCLAALLALCQEGIQKGHMRLHQKKSQMKAREG
jgi:hydroxymethylglutaryl-CoA reductase